MIKSFLLKNGKTLNIDYSIEYPFNKGQLYFCKNNLVYISAEPLSMEITKSFTFASTSMQGKMTSCLPLVHKLYEVTEGFALVISKGPEFFMLKNVQDNSQGKIHPVHVAWILNSIYNVCCYLDYTKITHGDINTETFFIAPETHAGALLGGWWGAKVKEESSEPLNRFSALVKKRKSKSDLEAVKAVGLELIADQEAHDSVMDFLHQPSSGDAKTDYKAWGTVLTEAFGPRKFVKMPFVEQA